MEILFLAKTDSENVLLYMAYPSLNMCVLSLKYEIFTSFSFFSFQNINLFSFGHLIKDGELLIKVSDQPPKKRYGTMHSPT